jgi:rhodanese-related sulfurtransferase
MTWLSFATAIASGLTGMAFWLYYFPPFSWGGLVFFWLFGLYAAWTGQKARKPIVVRLKGLAWTREDFCRGWLVTGDTGSGKTRSGINQLLFQIFKREPKWGGLCIDDKGVYWETLVEMAHHFKRADDLILLQIRPENALEGWKPPQTYNLISDPAIPFMTYAKFVVDTATSLGQRSEQTFFKNQAQTHIALGLEMLDRSDRNVTLENVHDLLLNNASLDEALKELATEFPTKRDKEIIQHFQHRYLEQPPEQRGGVRETIGNYLQCFLTPAVSEVFCATQNTFHFGDIDRSKILCVAMPQKYQTERRYVNTFLKMLFYTHVLRRFDKPKHERENDNLLVLWADEAQRFVTASDEGMSDYNCIDVMREARATLVATAQSSTSFIPPLGVEKARVLTLNLRNRLIFKAADEAGAIESADFLGQKKIRKVTHGHTGTTSTRSYTETEEHKIKPYQLRNLQKHQCILVHCDHGHQRAILPPLEANGSVSKWFGR